MNGIDREHLYVILLNTKHVVIAVELVSIGPLNASIVHPREIVKSAIAAGAATIIQVQNYPAGDPDPSREDIEFIKRLAMCGELIRIELMDHVIVGSGSYQSLKEGGYIRWFTTSRYSMS
jgi:DNA repair protein RadC